MKRILLTGDDGYNSIGTRLLIYALKETCALQVVATKHQQSGVGGKLSLSHGGSYGHTTIDGIPAVWVDGSPCDAMELSYALHPERFDLIISGVNMGANVTTAVISSGTFSAAVRGMGVGLAPKAMAISWDVPAELWYKKHDEHEDITPYLEYPGKMLQSLIEQTIQANYWGVDFLNINLPESVPSAARFTRFLPQIPRYYTYPIHQDTVAHTFDYSGQRVDSQENSILFDTVAMRQGYVSITPCQTDLLNVPIFEHLKDTVLTI